MLTLFWDERGVILEHYKSRGNTLTSAMHADFLKNHLLPEIKSQRRGSQSMGVLLKCDNARPILPVQLLQTSKISPSSVLHIRRTRQTSPPCDFHFFRPLKQEMGDKSFWSYEEMQQAVHERQRSQPREFCSRGIHALPKRWNTSSERNAEYIEK